jgi:hypothetical protein
LFVIREDQVIPIECLDRALATEFVELLGQEVLEKINTLQQLNAHGTSKIGLMIGVPAHLISAHSYRSRGRLRNRAQPWQAV